MDNFIVPDDETFKDIHLAILNNSAYTQLVSSMDKTGKQLPIGRVSWEMSLSAEQGFEPIVLTVGRAETYFIGFSPRTNFIGLFPRFEVDC